MADSKEVSSDATESTQGRPLRYRVAFFVTALIVVILVVTLPFSVKSVVDDILGPATGRAIQVSQHGSGALDTSTSARLRHRELQHYTKLHLAVIAIDEVQLLATIRVAGHHHCAECPWSHLVRVVAIADDDTDAHGLPPSAAIILAATDIAVSQTVQLPLRGHPIHYPFDRYTLVLGIAYQRLYPDGKREALLSDHADDQLFLSFQELLPRNTMQGPFLVDPQSVRAGDDPLAYTYAFEVRFARPPYVRVLAVMLVVLIAAAAAYSVFLRPLHDLVVNAGALVLGVWGIRGILTPGNLFYITAVDLALSLVIIFVLGALTIRALVFVHDEADLALLRRRRHPPGSSGELGARPER
jgi:hypothetical protein